ncbi:ABC transporter permease [Candidimonas nitroreducens]|nr:ABC transporter permease [Candidimonas nitroreducens]
MKSAVMVSKKTSPRRSRGPDVSVVLAFVALAAILAAVVLGDVITRYGATTPILGARLQPPSLAHFFGTDNFARDVFDRAIVGARTSIIIGLGTAIVSSVLGGACGILVAVWRGLDNFVMRILDGFIAFPPIILAILIIATFGGGYWQVIFALSVVFFPRIARVTRGVSLGVTSAPFVEAVKVMGGPRWRAAVRHVMPNTIGPIAVQATYVMARAIVIDAGLSFLGLSVPPPTPSWGNMLGEGRLYITQAWWLTIAPGLCIAVTAMAVNIIGDWLRDKSDVITGGKR